MATKPTTAAPSSSGAFPSVTTPVVVLILGGGVLVLLLVIGLVYLAGADGRASVLDWLSNVLLLVVSGTSTGALVQARKARVQTNGSLDVRMRQAIADALAARRASDDDESAEG